MKICLRVHFVHICKLLNQCVRSNLRYSKSNFSQKSMCLAFILTFFILDKGHQNNIQTPKILSRRDCAPVLDFRRWNSWIRHSKSRYILLIDIAYMFRVGCYCKHRMYNLMRPLSNSLYVLLGDDT